ncbi:helix-turn-helix domain-containing protein [Heyndrickxia sp. NPDC080065]|uniref:helix-turn-helix domain-containing protein n=1 Tax=Heyndrickxia sp. NPDC080065 TaxID=3390568 RepID=UPI003D078D85
MRKDSSNFYLHEKSNEFYWEGNGQLSIKTFTNGKAHYKTNKGFFAVEEDRYLLLNEGPYTISIEEDKEVESFCIFFKDQFAEEVLRTIYDSTEKLLTDPYKDNTPIGFFEKTYQSTLLSNQIQLFKNNLSMFQNDLLWKEEQFYKLMQTVIGVHQNTLKEICSLSALRASTREEIYRRINIAHDYIRAFYHRPITLQDISKIACLSPNHLLRNYSEVFGSSPHQHITELRLLKAKKLLRNLEYSITDITFEIGLNNPVSFSKMFKKHEGMSPMQYRKKVIMDKN